MMYLPEEKWSTPDPGDPPPCFRQGDIVELSYVRPDVEAKENSSIRISAIDVLSEPVVLLSTCCDLVIREPYKRKGIIVSPLRAIPKKYAKDPEALAALRAPLADVVGTQTKCQFNIYYYSKTATLAEDLITYLESVVMVSYDLLKRAKKLAELTDVARLDLKHRLVHHFTR